MMYRYWNRKLLPMQRTESVCIFIFLIGLGHIYGKNLFSVWILTMLTFNRLDWYFIILLNEYYIWTYIVFQQKVLLYTDSLKSAQQFLVKTTPKSLNSLKSPLLLSSCMCFATKDLVLIQLHLNDICKLL